MNYQISNVDKHQDTRGWICGHFFPPGNLLKTNNLEVKYSKMMPGETSPEHFHPFGEEIMLIIEGKIRLILDGKEHLLQTGDFVFQQANVKETLSEIIEPTIIVSIRTPSLPNNKVIVDNK